MNEPALFRAGTARLSLRPVARSKRPNHGKSKALLAAETQVQFLQREAERMNRALLAAMNGLRARTVSGAEYDAITDERYRIDVQLERAMRRLNDLRKNAAARSGPR